MIGEFERPGRRRAAQDRALRRYLRTHVMPYSTRYGEVLRSHPVTSVADLGNLPLEDVTSIDDPSSLVLRPSTDRIRVSGDRRLLWRMWLAGAMRRVTAFNRDEIDPVFKPIHWHLVEGVPFGYTAADLDRLAEIGRETLELAGLGPGDVLVGVQPAAPELSFWQIALGARDAGVSSVFLDDADVSPGDVTALGPNVLCGPVDRLMRVLEEGRAAGYSFAGLHTLLVLGPPPDAMVRGRLAALAGTGPEPAAVVAAWAPAGARAMWTECRNGTDLHTWPAAEVLEVVDPDTGAPHPPATEGEIVYSPLGWKGSVLLRVRTGIIGCLDDTPCVSCGRTSPRMRIVPALPPFVHVLDAHPDVELWQAELRTVDGHEELIVFVTPRRSGHPGALLRDLDRQLSVTQFVVLTKRELTARLKASDDARLVDHRGER